MYEKECAQCKNMFMTKYSCDKFCNGECRECFKRDDKLRRWAEGKRCKPNPKNAFRLYGLDA